MTHYPDLSPYEYFPSAVPMVNVGWLDPPHDFPAGAAPEGLAEALWHLAEEPRNMARGFHRCGFCESGDQYGDLPLASGEIHVDAGGVRYSAPVLVGHYVRDHGYLPPQVFADAVLERFHGQRARLEALLTDAGWEPGRSVDASAWRRAFPSFPWHDAAGEFLAEFGGLTVRGRETVELDPLRCVAGQDRLAAWKGVFPVGVTGVHLVGVDARGALRTFGDDAVTRVGRGSSAIFAMAEGRHLEDPDDDA